MIKYKILLSIIFFPFFLIYSQSEYLPGSVYYGRNNYIEYTAGNLPIIFSAPHGGSLTPSEIPDRTYGAIVNDTNTKELAQQFFNELHLLTGKYPHMIICNLRRIKLDANRDSIEAAQGNQYALQAWNEYHNFIRTASSIVNASFKKGLYLDLHGHGHTIQRLELGYLLSGSDLDKSNEELNTQGYVSKSSIKNLFNDNSSSYSFSEILRGDISLGTLFQSYNIPAVPSSAMLSPLGADYFSGGYSTQIHGSRSSGTIDGIQIEHHYSGIRNTLQNISVYAKIFAQVVVQFLQYNYNFNILSVESDKSAMPDRFSLLQNFPNPFNPSTTISYQVPKASHVTLKVYDVLGREVATLVDKYKPTGSYSTLFVLSSSFASGVYFYQLKAGNPSAGSGQGYVETKKMIVIK